MSKLNKAEQARVNGTKSRGPITPEGKKRCARNAVRHGILAKSICLTIENEDDFQSLLQSLIRRFQPADDVELRCLEQMAGCSLRLERCHVAETALFDHEMDQQQDDIRERYERMDPPTIFAVAFKSLADNSKALALYMRYESSIGRQYDRAYKHFLSLRENVPVPDEIEVEPAELPVPALISSEIHIPPNEPNIDLQPAAPLHE